MFKKFFSSAVMLILFAAVSSSLAATRTWTNANANQQWNDPVNWGGTVPLAADRAYISLTGNNCPIVGSVVQSTVTRIYLGQSDNGQLDITGGKLTVSDFFYVGYAAGCTGTINISSGTINVTNKLEIGYSSSNGIIRMTGGLVNTKYADLPFPGGVSGHLQLDGGLFICTSGGGFIINAGGSGDITDGTLQLAGNVTSLPGFSGWGTPGALLFSFDGTNTTIIADANYSPVAHHPKPHNGEDEVAINIPELQWRPSLLAVTQNFYFGTSFDDVNNATVPNIQGLSNTTTSVPTPGLPLERDKIYYWRIDTDRGPLGVNKGKIWSFQTTNKIQFCDDFEEDHDYLAFGTSDTFWDGIVGSEYLQAMSTMPDINDGKLYIESSGSWWDGSNHGVLLYKKVIGDWIATVEVTDYPGLYNPNHAGYINYNNCGIMARIGDLAAAGSGEDWISLDYYPISGVGNIVRSCNNNVRSELGNERTGWDGHRFLQVRRVGDIFYFSHSADSYTWVNSPASPQTRSDFTGLPVQLGIFHSMNSSNPGYVEYDDFCFRRQPAEKAYSPLPANGGSMDLMNGVISWAPGDFAVSRNVYFGLTYDDVNNATASSPQYRGPANVQGPDDSGRFSYNAEQFETLQVGNTYYWRIDEINLPQVWKGDVWRFTVQDYSPVDDFERYSETGYPRAQGTLRNAWIDGYYQVTFPSTLPLDATDGKSGSFVQIERTIKHGGARSMKLNYDNDGTLTWLIEFYAADPTRYTYVAPMYSEAVVAVDDAALLDPAKHDSLNLKRNWGYYKLIKLSLYGNPANTITATDKLYAGLWDGDNNPAAPVVVENPDNIILQNNWWQDWYVPLNAFTAKNSNLNLGNIARLYIGIGTRTAPATGGKGAVYIDDIELLAYGVCIPGSVVGDFDSDCTVNADDLILMTELWLGQLPSAGGPIIKLDASGLTLGDLTSWTNSGSEGGTFNVPAAPSTSPKVEMVAGRKAVTFDTLDFMVWTQTAPASITGADDWTVIMDVINPVISDQELVIGWAKRGGPDGTCAALGYGSNTSFGAAVHWGSPDLGFTRGVPEAAKWHTIAVTYDGSTETVLVDGIINASENKTLNIWDANAVTLGTYSLDAQKKIVPTDSYNFKGSVSRIEVYSYAMSPADLAVKMGTAVNLKNDNAINFIDLAVFCNRWLIGPVLLGN